MPATLTPLPISATRLRGYFASTLTELAALAQAAYPDAVDTDTAIDTLMTSAIRAAQWKLENLTGVPFFVTSYCTKELATQNSLILGTDFDQYVQPLDYRRDAWLKQQARTDLPKRPIKSVEQFRLTLENNAQVTDIDVTWLQVDREHGLLYVLPSGLATAGISFQTIYGLSIFLRGAATGKVPLLIHVRFTAGLVERTGTYADPNGTDDYAPDVSPKNTDWDQELVEAYQKALEKYAAALVMPQLGQYLDQGGRQISLDGLSENVNPQALLQRAEAYLKDATAWAFELKDSYQGPIMVTI
jgi:hypothetical protein